MNFEIEQRTILKVKHGSWAYGTNTLTSDIDIKGVCIEPMSHQLGFLHTFEQYEAIGHKNTEDQTVDTVIYSLKKFAALAADCNPNIIEILHVDPADVLEADEFGEQLLDLAPAFLSKRPSTRSRAMPTHSSKRSRPTVHGCSTRLLAHRFARTSVWSTVKDRPKPSSGLTTRSLPKVRLTTCPRG